MEDILEKHICTITKNINFYTEIRDNRIRHIDKKEGTEVNCYGWYIRSDDDYLDEQKLD